MRKIAKDESEALNSKDKHRLWALPEGAAKWHTGNCSVSRHLCIHNGVIYDRNKIVILLADFLSTRHKPRHILEKGILTEKMIS